MENIPFIFGKIAENQYFTDREEECKRLSQNFLGLVNTIIISPRRWGKSSLVKSAATTLMSENNDIKICLIDIFNIKNETDFYLKFAKNLLKSTSTNWEDWVANAKTFVSRLVPKITFSADNQTDLSFGIGLNEIARNPDDVIELAETIAKEKGIKIVVCIDEFQNIANFENPLAFQQKLRSHWQHHQNVCYCLYGSKRHVLIDIFSNPSMPFYKFGDIIFLEKIDTRTWGKFIQKRFKDTGKKIAKKDGEYLAALVANHPYYVQQLAQQAWLRTKINCSQAIIDASLQNLKNQLSLLFISIIDNLSATQTNFLKALLDGETVFGQENLQKYNLGTSANIVKIKESLIAKEVIDITARQIDIQDPVFALWLKEDYFRN
jgi:AAA+ ATPase superfamily predicted ATPase